MILYLSCPPFSAVFLDQSIRLFGTSRSRLIFFDGNRFDVFSQTVDKFPSSLNLVAPGKKPLITLKKIKQQALVGVRQFGSIRHFVGKFQTRLMKLHSKPRYLVIDLQKHALVRLNAEDHYIGRAVTKQTFWQFFVVYGNLRDFFF